jgi:hypothetical protein
MRADCQECEQHRCSGDAQTLQCAPAAQCKADRGDAGRREHQQERFGEGRQGKPPVVAAAARALQHMPSDKVEHVAGHVFCKLCGSVAADRMGEAMRLRAER